MYTKHVFTYIASLHLHFTEEANETYRNWTQVCAPKFWRVHTHTQPHTQYCCGENTSLMKWRELFKGTHIQSREQIRWMWKFPNIKQATKFSKKCCSPLKRRHWRNWVEWAHWKGLSKVWKILDHCCPEISWIFLWKELSHESTDLRQKPT